MAGRRDTKPSARTLEVQEESLSSGLEEEFLTDYDHLNSLEVLGERKREIKKGFENYTAIVHQYVTVLRGGACTNEAGDIINKFQRIRGSYRETLQKIHARRYERNRAENPAADLCHQTK